MLVLSRRVGESISIGNETTVRIIRINGNQIRLGIEAPDWVKVVRSELVVPLDSSSIPPPEPPHSVRKSR